MLTSAFLLSRLTDKLDSVVSTRPLDWALSMQRGGLQEWETNVFGAGGRAELILGADIVSRPRFMTVMMPPADECYAVAALRPRPFPDPGRHARLPAEEVRCARAATDSAPGRHDQEPDHLRDVPGCVPCVSRPAVVLFGGLLTKSGSVLLRRREWPGGGAAPTGVGWGGWDGR